jgi:microcystin-dependent protein
MKPLNLDNSPCSPISSNCVIWQGPNIPCIKLCTGDTVSDVVFKLATELCAILETLDVNNYDLACLNLAGCDPKDFQTLIQILINRICELENLPTPVPTPDGNGCPTDCIVAVDTECFPGAATDNLLNYVDRIATRVCELVGEISIIQDSIASINTTLISLQTQINNIPAYTLPDITIPTGCTIGIYTGPTSVELDTLFEAFLGDWCTYIATASTAAELAAVLEPACTLADNPYFGAITGLISPATNLADAISNIWTSICFLYDYNYAQTVVTGSGSITVTSSYNPVTNTTTYDVSSPAVFPAGVVVPWASPNLVPPIGWFICDGSNKDSAIYPDLFAAIGTTYGTLGGTSFFLPNMSNRIPVGKGTNADGFDLSVVSNTGGNRIEVLSDAQIPPHTHDLSATTFTATVSGTTGATKVPLKTASTLGTGGDPAANPRTGDYTRIKVGANNDLDDADVAQQVSGHTHSFSGSASGALSGTTGDGSPALQGLPHGNMQPYIVMQYIIKY